MDVTKINELSIDELHTLVNLIEGMPLDVNAYVKMHFGDKFLNPSLYNGKERRLHEFSTVKKYINKNDIIDIKNPMCSYYQPVYCKVKFMIINSKYPYVVQKRLVNLLDAESYDYETLIKTELQISNIIEDYRETNFVYDMADFISTEIMYYKLKVYDFYTYLTLKQSADLNLDDYNHMFHLNCCINAPMTKDMRFSNRSNLSILIYTYFSELGIQNIIDKYNLLNRFQFALLHNGNDEECIKDVIDRIHEMIDNRDTSTDALGKLIDPEEYGALMNMPKMTNSAPVQSNHSLDSNQITFFFKNINDIYGKEDELSTQIRVLSKKNILNYLQDKVSLNDITFSLSDNDYGHVRDIGNITIGTAYDNSDCEMKYIAFINNEPYILFKHRLSPNTVFGLSLTQNGSDRKLLEIKESNDFYYKYINNI